MSKKKKGPKIPGFADKYAKKIPDTFVSDVESMQLEEIFASCNETSWICVKKHVAEINLSI